MKKLIGILIATSLFTSLTAQVELIKQQPQALNGKGKIYALIVGISDYDNIRDLTYAHRDAEDFYHFLVHESGLNVDSNNIRKLTNKQATAANFGRELLKLKNKMDEGSTFFIYFAGHGDANGEAQAFLLASDLPKIEDPGLYAYTPGVIHVYNLKDEIRKIISDKKSQVVLVTDACRTNELAGSKAGAQTYVAKIMEQNHGEIQFISCAADEKSEESTQWGQGRGVFSYYFMNGLRGLADTRPADGKVTVRELFDYVQRNVEDATAITDAESADMAGKAYRQSPQYCCTEKQGVALVLVNEKLKQETIAKMAMENAAPSLASNTGRNAMRNIETKDSALRQLYDKFYVALDNNKLVSPAGNSAWDYYKMLERKAGKNEPWMFDAKEDMKAALLNDAQSIISAFYSYTDKWGMSDKTKRSFYSEGVDKLRKARSLMAKDDPMSPIVKMTRQCMEAAGYFASSQPDDWRRGIKIMDSAIAFSPKNPLPVFLKGRMFYNLRQHDSAMEYMHQAQHLAPLWSMPRIGMADIYMDTEQYDSAETILLEVAEKHEIALVYFKLGFFYGDHRNDPETAVFYSKAAHALAPEKTNIINNIGVYYERMGQEDSALHYYELSYSVDSNNAFTLKNLGLLYTNNYDYEAAEEAFERALKADSTEGTVYESLGILYSKKSKNTSLRLGTRLDYWKKSVEMYEKAVELKPAEKYIYIAKAKVETEVDVALAEKTMKEYARLFKVDADYYNELGIVYQEGGDTAMSLVAFYNGVALDSNYYYPLYNLGIHYFERGQWDSAIKYLSRAYEVDPQINYIYYKITEAENNLEEIKRTEQTEAQKQKLIKLVNAGDKEALLELAEIYYYWYNYDSAYKYYTDYIDYNPGCDDSVYKAYLFSARSIGYTYSWDRYHGNTGPGEIFLTAIGKIGRQAVERKKGSMAYIYIEAVTSAGLTDSLPVCEQVYQGVLEGDPGYEYTADLAAFIAKSYDYANNQEKALEWLEIALEKGYSAEYAGYYNNFENLQDNKKYQKLLKKYRKKQGIKEPEKEEWEYNYSR